MQGLKRIKSFFRVGGRRAFLVAVLSASFEVAAAWLFSRGSIWQSLLAVLLAAFPIALIMNESERQESQRLEDAQDLYGLEHYDTVVTLRPLVVRLWELSDYEKKLDEDGKTSYEKMDALRDADKAFTVAVLEAIEARFGRSHTLAILYLYMAIENSFRADAVGREPPYPFSFEYVIPWHGPKYQDTYTLLMEVNQKKVSKLVPDLAKSDLALTTDSLSDKAALLVPVATSRKSSGVVAIIYNRDAEMTDMKKGYAEIVAFLLGALLERRATTPGEQTP